MKIRFRNFPYSHNMAGKTVGIIGFGNIGQMVAARLKPFGVNLVLMRNICRQRRYKSWGHSRYLWTLF